ncbi:MAG: GTPase, partial [Clostridiales bacterium]|nr:GTPase [Clostridiales bacterium]
MSDCLVYFFTGFLDSGKTSVICSWIGGENFKDKKVVVISTEEGEEEYIEENYEGADPVIISCETKEV